MPSPSPKSQSKSKQKRGKEFGLWAVTKISYHMVKIEDLSDPECQEGVPFQGGHQREDHRVVHHVQYEGHFK